MNLFWRSRLRETLDYERAYAEFREQVISSLENECNWFRQVRRELEAELAEEKRRRLQAEAALESERSQLGEGS